MSERLKPQVKTIVTLTPRHGEDHPSSPALSRRPPLVIIHPDAQHPAEHVATALRYQVRTSFAWGGGRERCERLRLVASDSDFVVGDGSQVCGTSIALLLAVSGRPVKDGELTGDGAGALMEARR
jgi:hypothetical protein